VIGAPDEVSRRRRQFGALMPFAPTVSLSAPLKVGLANELTVIAKAHLAARALGIPMVRPTWGWNRRPYWRYFSYSRLDIVWPELATRIRRVVTFTEADYRATGVLDYGAAVASWARDRELVGTRTAIVNEGMWGGKVAVEEAREFVRAFMRCSRWTSSNIESFRRRRTPGRRLVAVHVRLGDFAAPVDPREYRHAWNVALPLEWYRHVCRELRAVLDDVDFLVLSDDPAAAAPLVSEFDALTTTDRRRTDISDLLLLSSADVIVCSISSFSLVAAWLGEGRYVWPREQMDEQGAWLSLWGHQPAQKDGLTAQNRSALAAMGDARPHGRGVAVAWGSPLPVEFVDDLRAHRRCADRRADLIYYGVIPA